MRKLKVPKFWEKKKVDRSFCVKSNVITKWIWPHCDIHSVASIVGEKSWWAWTHEGEGGKQITFFSPSFLACLNLRNTELTICLESHEKCLSHHHCQAGNHGLFPVSIPSSVYHTYYDNRDCGVFKLCRFGTLIFSGLPMMIWQKIWFL